MINALNIVPLGLAQLTANVEIPSVLGKRSHRESFESPKAVNADDDKIKEIRAQLEDKPSDDQDQKE